MNRRLIGIIAGVSVLGLGVPALANARDGGDGTPEDNGVSGDVRGNCDEAEHANDPECLGADPSTTTIVVTTTIEEETTTTVEETTTTTLVPDTLPATTEATVPDTTPVTSLDDDDDDDVDGTVPDSSVPDTSTPVNTVDDDSGHCDDGNHADEIRCGGTGLSGRQQWPLRRRQSCRRNSLRRHRGGRRR